VAAGRALAEAGADWIDLGGESTRPGAVPVSAQDELARVMPVLTALRAARLTAGLSIDTTKGVVAEAALAAGASLVNDVSGGEDPHLLAVTAAAGARLILMHRQGSPATMQVAPHYDDVVAEVGSALGAAALRAEAAGVMRSRILVDPGIGFGKTVAHNLALLRALPELAQRAKAPIALGLSRKRFLAILGGGGYPAGDGLGHLLHALFAPHCALLRVHDVAGAIHALRHSGLRPG
jgi:dihydropteroate synthase